MTAEIDASEIDASGLMRQGLMRQGLMRQGLMRKEDVKKSISKFAVNSAVKKIALGCRISDRWAVGKGLGSKIKSRKLKEINFFTSSRREWYF